MAPLAVEDIRETLVEYEQVVEQLSKIKRERGMAFYVPNPTQLRAHKSLARTILYVGGNRSGKSTFGAMELAYHLTRQYPDWFPRSRRFDRPIKAVVLATEFPVIERVIEPKIMAYLPKDLIHKIKRSPQGYMTRLVTTDGSTVDLLTGEMDDMACESADWDFYWGDEPQKKTKFHAIQRGLIDRRGYTVLTFTPLIEPWMKEELVDKRDGKEIDVIHATMRDNLHDIEGNPILRLEEIQRFEQLMPDDVRMTRVEGQFFHLRGIVYKEYTPSMHERDFQYEFPDPVICVMDPHDRLPHWVIWAFVDRNDWVYIDRELVFEGTIQELKKTILLTEAQAKYKIVKRLIDPNFGRKPLITTGRTVIQELALKPFPVRFGEANDDKEAGRMKIKDMLHWNKALPIGLTNSPKLFFHPTRVRGTIHSIQNYQYDDWRGQSGKEKDPKEKEKQKDTHGADVVRYLCMSNPHFDRLTGKWAHQDSDQLVELPY